MLRGVNTGGRSKFAPFFPFPFLESGLSNQADAPSFGKAATSYFERIAGWGHNIVRLPFTWEALEPTRGTYDALFLERYLALIAIAQKLGIRVIVDFHQDVFAWPYCGDGFPIWACPQPVPERPDDCKMWFLAYITKGSPSEVAFDRFWANEDGLRDAFAAMWTHMAAAAWPHDNVIGFEIMNEPHRGSQDEAVWLSEVLQPFYKELGQKLQETADGALVFFDATGLDATTQQTKLQPPGNSQYVFAPHYYLMAIYAGGELDLSEVSGGLGRWAEKHAEWSLPVLVGEFGIPRSSPKAALYLRAVMDALDTHLLHGTAWEVSTTVDEWNDEGMSLIGLDGQEAAGVQELIRVYPSAVAGTVLSFSYNVQDKSAELVFDATKDGVTELAVPASLYPEGVRVTVEGQAGCSQVDEQLGRVYVRVMEAGKVTVRVEAN
jgi:endoglycosylceramidase